MNRGTAVRHLEIFTLILKNDLKVIPYLQQAGDLTKMVTSCPSMGKSLLKGIASASMLRKDKIIPVIANS